MISKYEDPDRIKELVDRGEHRGTVGGMWEEIGNLQRDLLVNAGLQPHHTVLDAGCGSLRAGTRLIDLVEPRHYFGFDRHLALIEAGYEHELCDRQKARFPREQLAVGDITKPVPFCRAFDFILVFSVFTHLSHEKTKIALGHLTQALSESGKILATFFLAPQSLFEEPVQQTANIVSYCDRDPFHWTSDQISSAAEDVGLNAVHLERFDHPRGQSAWQLSRP